MLTFMLSSRLVPQPAMAMRRAIKPSPGMSLTWALMELTIMLLMIVCLGLRTVYLRDLSTQSHLSGQASVYDAPAYSPVQNFFTLRVNAPPPGNGPPPAPPPPLLAKPGDSANIQVSMCG